MKSETTETHLDMDPGSRAKSQQSFRVIYGNTACVTRGHSHDILALMVNDILPVHAPASRSCLLLWALPTAVLMSLFHVFNMIVYHLRPSKLLHILQLHRKEPLAPVYMWL